MGRGGVGTARRVIGAGGPARGYLGVAALLGLALAGLILAQAGLLAHALAAVPSPTLAAPGHGASSLRSTLIALLLVVLARAATSCGAETAALRAAALVKERLRSRLIRRCAALCPSSQRPGEVTTLATSGLDSLDPYVGRYLPQLWLAAVVPVAVLITVTLADWVSGLIIAVTLPLIPVFAALVGLRVKDRARRDWQALARLGGHFLDIVQGLATLKVFGRTGTQEQVIGRVTDEYRRSVMATLRIAFMSALVLELSAALATALVAVEVGLRLLYGHLGYPTALLVLLLTPEAYLPLRNAAAAYHAGADGATAAERALEIIDAPSPVSHSSPARPVSPDLRSQPIIFNEVSLGYPARPDLILRDVDLTIAPGERVTITGPNGAGKSTLLSLLLRFIDPIAGSVWVADVPLAEVPAELWRQQIGWLPQHPALFPWTIAENIALSAVSESRKVPGAVPGGRGTDASPAPAGHGATRQAIERASRLAGADSFIRELPAGYDTVLDERGLRLSAGQRQKLALARLFLRDAPLLLLDEPTAHLDPASAAEVAGALALLGAGRTVVVVTHQEASLRSPSGSRALLVANGQVTEPAARSTTLAGST